MAQSSENEKHTGIAGEMFALSLDEACQYYKNYLNNFQVDIPLSINFIGRVSGEPSAARSPVVRPILEQAIKSAVNLAPLDPDILQIGLDSGLAPGADVVLKIIQATHVEHESFKEMRKAPFKQFHADLRRACTAVLAKHPMAVRFADMLLSLDLFAGTPPCEPLSRFNCPKALRLIWDKRLFDHFATLGHDEAAWPLWERLKSQINEPIALARAAEMHRRAGRTGEAVELYERAFALDPLQRPYALRAEALRRPFVPDAGLLSSKKVCIYLYSYNKATILGETLESLAATDIGPARIKVLLNGCTDDSAAVVARARGLFPKNDFEVIELPVNIGAPAARNWLLSQPTTRECDYVAFLDDDIYLQPDWLSHLLTVAESDPKIGNVGCKVVFPGTYRLLQYLYRHISFCTEEAIRASIPVPYMQYDIGLYDVIRETRVVMGCQHLLRVASLADAPWFDIRYSPSQIDDTDHDLQLCLAGWKVMYCGTVTCVHRQNSGTSMRSKLDIPAQGSIMGNDVKFHYKWLERMDEMRRLDSLSLNT